MITDLKHYKSTDITELVNNAIAIAAIIALLLILGWMNDRDQQDYKGQINTATQCV